MPKRRKAQIRPKQLTQAELNQGLEQAAISGDLAAFTDFLQRGASLDASEADANMLVTAGAQPAIRDLLTNPTNGLYKQFNDGTTELHLAAIRNDVDTIQAIFESQPERMLESTIRGESVLNWANYFMRHKVISFLLTHEVFEDKLEQEQTDDAYYDLARGHELLADYFVEQHHLDFVAGYYEAAIEFYGLMQEGAHQLISQVEAKLADFNERYPVADECDSVDAASTRADDGAEESNQMAGWNELWSADWSDDSDSVPFDLVRQGAVADLRQLDATVQPVETVQVILQPEPVMPVQSGFSLLDDALGEIGEAIAMVEDSLVSLEAAVKKAGADFVEGLDVAGVHDDLAKLKEAAMSLGAEAVDYLDQLGRAIPSVVSQISGAACVNPALSPPLIEMEVFDDDILALAAATPSPSLSSSPMLSRSSSTASLGLTGLFASSSGRSSPVNPSQGPASLRMTK